MKTLALVLAFLLVACRSAEQTQQLVFESQVNSNNFSVDGNVVFIGNDAFSFFPNVMKTLSALQYANCGVVLSNPPCPEACYLAMHVDLDSVPNEIKRIYGNQINEKNLEGVYQRYISSMMTVHRYSGHAEIYNYCSANLPRKEESARTLFRNVLTSLSEILGTIWIGVNLDNSIFESIVSLYSSVGFGDPEIQTITPSGFKRESPFVGFWFRNPGDTPNPFADEAERVRRAAIQIKDNYISRKPLCSFNFHLSPPLLQTARNRFIQNENIESGGAFVVQSALGPGFVLNIPLGSITEGRIDNFVANPPAYYINWHTHPFVCYLANRCFIGWPSGNDMGKVFGIFKEGVLAHLLLSNEGVYILQLAPEAMAYVDRTNDQPVCMQAFRFLTEKRYNDLESYREIRSSPERQKCWEQGQSVSCLTYDGPDTESYINNFVNLANIETFEDLLNWAKGQNSFGDIPLDVASNLVNSAVACLKQSGTDFKSPIYSVHFINWAAIEENGLFATLNYIQPPTNNASCPLPFYGAPGELPFGPGFLVP